MTEAEALATLRRQSAADHRPVLPDDDLLAILRDARRPDRDLYYPDGINPWRAAVAVAAGDVVTPSTRNGHFYVATGAGSPGATEPTWPVATGATVEDNGIIWTEAGQTFWTYTVDLNAATADAWQQKAGMTADLFAVSDTGQSLSPQQIHDHCLTMAKSYRRRCVAEIRIAGRAYRPSLYPNPGYEYVAGT